MEVPGFKGKIPEHEAMGPVDKGEARMNKVDRSTGPVPYEHNMKSGQALDGK